MSKYGIDWSKVDRNTRLAEKAPEVTAVTEQAARPKSARAKREAKPDTVVRSQRREAAAKKTPAAMLPDGTVVAVDLPLDDEGIDLVPEDANGEKIVVADGDDDEGEE